MSDPKDSSQYEKPVNNISEAKEEQETKKSDETPAKDDEKVKDSNTEENTTKEVPDVVTDSEKYKTYEEDEACLFEARAKLYRLDVENSQWRERGTGSVRLLKNDKKTRLLMRREKTYKICGHQYVLPMMELKPNKNSEMSWIWNCPADYSEEGEKPKSYVCAIRFTNIEDTQTFKKIWDECRLEYEKAA